MPIFRRTRLNRIWCSALVVLAVVVCSWDASCVHCVKVVVSSISTCFRHHYAHLHENKTVCNRMWCSALVVPAVVMCSWDDASCVHCAKVVPSISTCFRHHYAHLHKNKTVYNRIQCSALVVLAVVVCSCDASCVHCVKVIVPSISTCFRHHYAHLQEKKTVYNRIRCSALVVLAMVVWSWDASCVHCVKVVVQTTTFTQCTQHNQC